MKNKLSNGATSLLNYFKGLEDVGMADCAIMGMYREYADELDAAGLGTVCDWGEGGYTFKITRENQTASDLSASAGSHQYQWWGNQTSRCTKCAKLLLDEDAEKDTTKCVPYEDRENTRKF